MASALEVFRLVGRLVLDKSEYDDDVKDADKSGKSLAENLSSYMEKAKKVLVGLGIAAAVKKTAGAVWNLAKEVSVAGDRIDKQSQALGLSRKAFQEWDYILAQSGASIDSLGGSMRAMNNAIMENSAETAAGLSRLGLSAAYLQSIAPEKQFEEIVRAFQKMPAGAQKSQLAMQLLGRGAQSLMPLLNSSSDSIDDLREQAEKLGLIMSDEDVDASVAFGDALDDLSRTWTSFKNKIGAQFLPGFTSAFKTLSSSLGSLSGALTGALKTGDWATFFSTLTDEIGRLIPGAVDTIIGIVNGIFANADKLVSLAVSIVSGVASGIIDAIPVLVEKLPTIVKTIWEGSDGTGGLKSLASQLGNWIIDEINSAFGLNLPHIENITFPTWEEVKADAETAWKAIQDGLNGLALTLGKFVFGERDDGSIDWPTWEEVGLAARTAWESIINGLTGLVTGIGKFVFGERDDTAIVDWPTWEDVRSFAATAWTGIQNGLAGLGTALGAFVFGVRDDNSVNWPTWEDVGNAAATAWQGIRDGLAGLANTIGAFVFGTRDDGAIDWPDWSSIQQSAVNWWNGSDGNSGIKGQLQGILTWTLGIFTNPDITVITNAMSTWWNDTKATVIELLDWGLGTLNLPKWSDIKTQIETWWNDNVASLALNFSATLDKVTFGNYGDSESGWSPQITNDGTTIIPEPVKPLGAFAKGLNYVPYDGIALLHRGETVLNQARGREWRQNNNGINQQALYSAVASAVAAAVSGIQINMDGRAVGNAVTDQVSRNIYRQQIGFRSAAL